MTSILWGIFLIILTFVFFMEMKHSMKRSSESNRLISTYINDLENPALIEEIFSYCQNDFKLRRILRKHQATAEDISLIYHKLLVWGNFKKGRRFVPITSFFHVYSLNYLLEHKNDEEKDLTMKMFNFFHI